MTTSGTPLPIVAATTGCLASLELWLDDGVTQSVRTSAALFTFSLAGPRTFALTLIPANRGRFRLWARVTDPSGVTAGTGLVRTVIVQ